MIMKNFIKREEYKPISSYKNGYRILWDYEPSDNEEYGTCYEFIFNYKPNLQLIKRVIIDFYNKEIDNKILSGFTWKDIPIWLSSENQFNYKAAYDLAVQTNGATLPITMKFGDSNNPVYHTFTDMDEFTDFYTSSIKFIQETLYRGWIKKDTINWEDYNIE